MMRIRDIDNPELFQRLVQALFRAEYGDDFEVVDDARGDAGDDGYVRSKKLLLAIYCPMVKASEKAYRRKVRDDLAKAIRLRDHCGYKIKIWAFVTPADVPAPVVRYVRERAAVVGMQGVCFGETRHAPLFEKNSPLHDQFVGLDASRLSRDVRAIRRRITQLVPARSAKESVGRLVTLYWKRMDDDVRIIVRIAAGLAIDEGTGVYSSQLFRAMGSVLTGFSPTAGKVGLEPLTRAESKRFARLAQGLRSMKEGCSGYLFTAFRRMSCEGSASGGRITAKVLCEIVLKYAQGPEARWLRARLLQEGRRGFLRQL